jgi:hypothetical protein
MAETSLSGGSDGYVELFTIEEDGIIAVTGKCTENLAGATATIQIGLLGGDTDALIPVLTATDIDTSERLDRSGLLDAATPSNATPFLPVLAGQTVIATVLVANITDGTIEFTMQHRPFGAANTGAPTEAKITVANTSTAVFSANPHRKYLQLVNDSDEIIYVSVDGAAAVLNTGTRLNAAGGSVVFDTYVPGTAITAICTSGSKVLLGIER